MNGVKTYLHVDPARVEAMRFKTAEGDTFEVRAGRKSENIIKGIFRPGQHDPALQEAMHKIAEAIELLHSAEAYVGRVELLFPMNGLRQEHTS